VARPIGLINLLLQPPALEILHGAGVGHNRLGDREAKQALAIVRAPEAQEALLVGQMMPGSGEIQRAGLSARRRRGQQSEQQRQQHRAGAPGSKRHGRTPLFMASQSGMLCNADYNAKHCHVKGARYSSAEMRCWFSLTIDDRR
jgi:hypothetical protein